MGKVNLFLSLYRKKRAENIIICALFSLLGAVISMVLFVQSNNLTLLKNQFVLSGLADGANGTSFMTPAESDIFLGTWKATENVIGMIAIAAILVGTIGGACLIGFRNASARKATVMMHIFGMQKKDLLCKAAVDAALFGILSSCMGYTGGYLLFLHFSRKIMMTAQVVGFGSPAALGIYFKTLILNGGILFWGNLFTDLKEMETSVTGFLYGRKGRRRGRRHIMILFAGLTGMIAYSLMAFHVNRKYLMVSGLVVILLASVLFFLFTFFFGVITKRKRASMKIRKPVDLSFCFLCSRNQRDAALAIVISVGTIILCLAANLLFSVDGMLRSAYRDNMGYTSVIFVEDSEEIDIICAKLEEYGYLYTAAYTKLMDYAELNGMAQEKGKFWALVLGKQTDGNPHLSVPTGAFLAENYFAYRCGLMPGETVRIFGEEVRYDGNITDLQYLSLVNYSFLVHEEDWKLGMDEGFRPIFFLDISAAEERQLKNLLEGYSCHVESASELIDELKEALAEYMDILALVAGMIFLVTVTVFYTVIRADLEERKTENYLYRIFGASFRMAQKVIFHEYLLIGLITSFAVSFTVMLCGELYFYYGLRKHFPLSIPVTAATTVFAVFFIFLCWRLAARAHTGNTGLEAIRDE